MRSDRSGIEPRSRGMVVVAVGGGQVLQQLFRASGARTWGQDRHELQFGLKGATRNLLEDQLGVVKAVAGALPALPEPAPADQCQRGGGAECGHVPDLASLEPLVALQRREGGQPEHSQGQGIDARLVGGSDMRSGRVVGGPELRQFLVGAGPLRSQRAQQQAADHALTPAQPKERAQRGEQGGRNRDRAGRRRGRRAAGRTRPRSPEAERPGLLVRAQVEVIVSV